MLAGGYDGYFRHGHGSAAAAASAAATSGIVLIAEPCSCTCVLPCSPACNGWELLLPYNRTQAHPQICPNVCLAAVAHACDCACVRSLACCTECCCSWTILTASCSTSLLLQMTMTMAMAATTTTTMGVATTVMATATSTTLADTPQPLPQLQLAGSSWDRTTTTATTTTMTALLQLLPPLHLVVMPLLPLLQLAQVQTHSAVCTMCHCMCSPASALEGETASGSQGVDLHDCLTVISIAQHNHALAFATCHVRMKLQSRVQSCNLGRIAGLDPVLVYTWHSCEVLHSGPVCRCAQIAVA